MLDDVENLAAQRLLQGSMNTVPSAIRTLS
jgi:hypothetical protein